MKNEGASNAPAPNPFAASGLFVDTADTWTPFKMSFEGFAGGGKTFTMCCVAVGVWEAEGKTGSIVLQDTERSAKFIVPFFYQFGLVQGKNFFVTHSRSLQRWGEILEMAEQQRGTIFLTDTVTHVYEDMMIQFEKDNNRKVKYPQDAMIVKPMWKERFSTPFTKANNTHLFFTGRAADVYRMEVDEDTGKKEFNVVGVKMRGDNELAYEPDVVVLMERLQQIKDGSVEIARGATILKDRSRLIDGQNFVFRPLEPGKDREAQAKIWKIFEPVYKCVASGNKDVQQNDSDKSLGPLFVKGAGEAWYQQKLRAERLVEEIKGVFDQWGLGGTGGVEKAVRANLYKLIFDNRTTGALAEMHPDDLRTGLDMIEHMARFAAKNMELIEKLFKGGQHEKLGELLAEEEKKYVEAVQQAPEVDLTDDVPDFSSNGNETKEVQTEPTRGEPVEPIDETAKEAEVVAVIEAIRDAQTPAQADQIFADRGASIAAMDDVDRRRCDRARTVRKKQLRNGGVGAGA